MIAGRHQRNRLRAPGRAAAALAFAAATALLSGGAVAQQIELKMTTYVPVGSGTWNAYMKPFIEHVTDLTDGAVAIRGFSVGVLSSPFDAWQAVQKGTADICFCYPSFAANADPVNAILGGIAGGMTAATFMDWIYYADGGDLWRAFRRETGDLFPVITGFGPSEIFLHSHKKVATIADLKGMKIRTTGAWADILKELGASPTVLAPTDIYTALERHVIDATEFITPATNIKLGFQKIAKYIIIPGIHQPTHANEVVFRAKDWDKLSAKLRSRITLAGRLAAMDSWMGLRIQDLDAMKKLRAGKNVFVTLKPSFLAKVTELARDWTAKQAAKQAAKGNMWMTKVSDSYWAFYDKDKKYGDYRVR